MIDLDNTVIELIDKEHGQKVKKFFLEHCSEKYKNSIDNCDFINTKSRGISYRFYGFLNGYFSNYNLENLSKHSIKHPLNIARLEDFELKFPREMYVWNGRYLKEEAKKKLVLFIVPKVGIITLNDEKEPTVVSIYANAMEVDEWEAKYKPKEYTIEELEEKLGQKIKIVKSHKK